MQNSRKNLPKNKEKPRPKYPSMGNSIFHSRIITVNQEFSIREAVVKALRNIAEPKALVLAGYLGKRDRLETISYNELHERLSIETASSIYLLFQEPHPLEIKIVWFPPAEFDVFSAPCKRVEVAFGYYPGWTWEDARIIFCEAIQEFSPHWGELNLRKMTQVSTLCNINAHNTCAPRPGTMNYYGPEYTEFFGGSDRIKAAGFSKVENFHKGLIASFGIEIDHETYLQLRTKVENNLAHSECFDPMGGKGCPRFNYVDI